MTAFQAVDSGSIPGARIMIQNSQNLHSHTYLSDGKMTHGETLDIAAANGCSVVAFTDHDILPDEKVLNELESLRGHKTKWVIGIELSTNIGHVIGLFVDPHNEALLAHTKKMRSERIKKASAMTEALSRLGFKISAEEVLARAAEGNVAKPHVVEALMSHPENISLLETYIEKLRLASETDQELKKDYLEAKEMSEKRGIGMFVYPIFLRSHAFVPGVHVDYEIEPNLEDGVGLIRDADGVAILAHWHTVKKNLPLEHLGKLLIEKRLDGVETLWGLNAYGTSGEEEMRADNTAVGELARRLDGLSSVALDAHTKSDYESLGQSDFFAKQTLGAVQKIIARSGVSTKFSSLGV